MELSRHLQAAVIGEMRRLLIETRDAHRLVEHYEEATGRSKAQLLREAAEADDRRHVLEGRRHARKPAGYRDTDQRGAKADQRG